MKLLNQSLKHLTLSILAIVSIWSVVFYFNMLDEIYDSIDDGLDNYKLLIIRKAERDQTILSKSSFDESNYAIREIGRPAAIHIRDLYEDTLMYMQNEEEMEPVRLLTTAFENDGRFYELKVISSMVEEDDQIANLFWSILWLYIILMLSIFLINNYALQRLWEPFYSLLAQMKSYRIDKNDPLPEIVTDTDEFLELQEAGNTLIRHSLASYTSQKQFTENAAHELQTPLAVLTGKLELLLEKGELKTDDARELGEVLQTVERLRQLNSSLLLLSKIENKQYFDNQTVSINTTVRQCRDDLEEYAQFREIELELEEDAELSVYIDPSLAHILVSNLLKNAIFHNQVGGRIRVSLTSNRLSVSNTARDGKLDEQSIFKRFHKNSTSHQRVGLGLAIAQAICKLYDFELSYRFNNEHCFEVAFLA